MPILNLSSPLHQTKHPSVFRLLHSCLLTQVHWQGLWKAKPEPSLPLMPLTVLKTQIPWLLIRDFLYTFPFHSGNILKRQCSWQWSISGHWFPSLMTVESHWGLLRGTLADSHCLFVLSLILLMCSMKHVISQDGHSMVINSPPECFHLVFLTLLLIWYNQDQSIYSQYNFSLQFSQFSLASSLYWSAEMCCLSHIPTLHP